MAGQLRTPGSTLQLQRDHRSKFLLCCSVKFLFLFYTAGSRRGWAAGSFRILPPAKEGSYFTFLLKGLNYEIDFENVDEN